MSCKRQEPAIAKSGHCWLSGMGGFTEHTDWRGEMYSSLGGLHDGKALDGGLQEVFRWWWRVAILLNMESSEVGRHSGGPGYGIIDGWRIQLLTTLEMFQQCAPEAIDNMRQQ